MNRAECIKIKGTYGIDYDFTHWAELPKVSCTCITYGRPHLIGEAVKSFMDQDYYGDIELVILNDQPEINYTFDVERLGLEHCMRSVKIINNPKRIETVGEKRNICTKASTGSIILPWDDDDIHLPWRVSLTVAKMKNHHYWKGDRLWVHTGKGLKKNEPNKAMAPSMAGYSRAIFDKVGGYDHIQSGQDQTLDNRITKEKVREVAEVTNAETYYMYRFGGTDSYHLSLHGYGKGFEQASAKVESQKSKYRTGVIDIVPHYKQDYLAMIQPFRKEN